MMRYRSFDHQTPTFAWGGEMAKKDGDSMETDIWIEHDKFVTSCRVYKYAPAGHGNKSLCKLEPGQFLELKKVIPTFPIDDGGRLILVPRYMDGDSGEGTNGSL